MEKYVPSRFHSVVPFAIKIERFERANRIPPFKRVEMIGSKENIVRWFATPEQNAILHYADFEVLPKVLMIGE